jgi:hypothetical protein
MAFHNLKSEVADLGIVRNFRKVSTDERKGLFTFTLFDLENLFNAFAIKNIATDAVGCICWINDNPTLLKAFHNLADQTGLRIYGVDGDKHAIAPRSDERLTNINYPANL